MLDFLRVTFASFASGTKSFVVAFNLDLACGVALLGRFLPKSEICGNSRF